MADLHSKILDMCPPGGPNSFNFMQFLGKFGKIVCWHPPGELVPLPWGNPGSATGGHGGHGTTAHAVKDDEPENLILPDESTSSEEEESKGS